MRRCKPKKTAAPVSLQFSLILCAAANQRTLRRPRAYNFLLFYAPLQIKENCGVRELAIFSYFMRRLLILKILRSIGASIPGDLITTIFIFFLHLSAIGCPPSA